MTTRVSAGLLLLIMSVTLSPAGIANADNSTDYPCNAPTAQEGILRYNDYRWFYDRDEMRSKYAEVYDSGLRLIDRARWNSDRSGHELIYRTVDSMQAVPISAEFIGNIASHIERGLELDYFEYVFFPDMGHAHLLIPQSYYDSTIAKIPIPRQREVFVQVLAHPETRYLYHTAEQLRMLDEWNNVLPDKYLGWRYFTRNVVGRNNSLGMLDIHSNLGSIGNTVCRIQGPYRYWGAGFHISASKDGCFSFTHEQETVRFDISLSDLPSDPDEYDPMVHGDANSSHDVDSDSASLWGAANCMP